MSVILEESTIVAAPPARVWPLLVDPRTWRTWWPGCRDAVSRDRRPLHEGSTVSQTLQISWLTTTLRLQVQICAENKTLVWKGGGSRLHAWYLQERPEGTRVTQRRTFSAPAAFLLRLLRLDGALRKMLRGSLGGLKRVVERMV
jgi:uncharacterized protein YndB with AHSA1/START domain